MPPACELCNVSHRILALSTYVHEAQTITFRKDLAVQERDEHWTPSSLLFLGFLPLYAIVDNSTEFFRQVGWVNKFEQLCRELPAKDNCLVP